MKWKRNKFYNDIDGDNLITPHKLNYFQKYHYDKK